MATPSFDYPQFKVDRSGPATAGQVEQILTEIRDLRNRIDKARAPAGRAAHAALAPRTRRQVMPHIHHADARKSHGDKLAKMTGERGEYPPDRAARIACCGPAGGQGDASKVLDEAFVGAPARQVSNTGQVKGD